MNLDLSKKLTDYNLPDAMIKRFHKKSIITLQDFITYVSEYTAWKYRGGYLFPLPTCYENYNKKENLRTIIRTETSLGIPFSHEEYNLLWYVLNLDDVNQIFVREIDIRHLNIIDYFTDWDEFSKCGINYVRINELDFIKNRYVPRCATVQNICDRYFILLYKYTNNNGCIYFESSAMEILFAFKEMKKSQFFKDRYFKLTTTRTGKPLKQTIYPYNLFSDMVGINITKKDIDNASKTHLVQKYLNDIVMCENYHGNIDMEEIENRYQDRNIFPMNKRISDVNVYINYIYNEVDKLKKYIEKIEGGELFNGFYSNGI